MSEHPVVIVGGGPTGLMLGAELQLAGIDVVIVERRPDQELESARARGLHARTLEVLDQRGVADRFVKAGAKYQLSMFTVAAFAADLPTRHNYTLGLVQKHVERILAEWVLELGVDLRYSAEVSGIEQDADGAQVRLADGTTLRARYVVGCDGGRSLVRGAAGIELVGWDASMSWLIAEAKFSEEPRWGFFEDARGRHAIGKADDGFAGLVINEDRVHTEREPGIEDLRAGLVSVYGTDFGVHSPRFVSRFTDAARQATTYRNGRLLLAGDAAHVHSPVGGQGLNLGMQDAVNLGWKLAQVVKGVSPEALLDTYQAERHPVAARVLRTNLAQVALGRTDERTKALRELLTPLFASGQASRQITAMMSGLDIRYDLGEGHALLGRRMPDLDIVTPRGAVTTCSLLHRARPVLLNFGEPGGFELAGWCDRVDVVDATYDGAWEVPSVGPVDAPVAVLVRPDGHVAWVGDRTQAGLGEALERWFGRARWQSTAGGGWPSVLKPR